MTTIENLESLQIEYIAKTTEYNKLGQDYATSLKSGTKKDYVVTKDKAYFGTSFYNVSSGKTIDTCKASCSSDPKCSGASYQPGLSGRCYLATGEGSIVSYPNVYAIVPPLKNIAEKLEGLNQQLLTLNSKIQANTRDNSTTDLNNWINQNNNKHTTLVADYNKLVSQREQIHQMILEYDNVNGNLTDTSLQVKQLSINYRLYSILLALILCLIVMFAGGMSISLIIVPLILAAILFILDMSMFSFIIVCGVVLYYIYSIPM
jgi:hypothetical protein